MSNGVSFWCISSQSVQSGGSTGRVDRRIGVVRGPEGGPCAEAAAARRSLRAARGRSGSLPAALAIALAATWLIPGCVERRMTIRTNVDDQGGALAIVDKQEVGFTPVSTGFTYYGPREIKLIKDGYETATFVQPIEAPWWDSPPLEFFVENLLPVTLRDEREFYYELLPARQVRTDEVLDRAQQLRREASLSCPPSSGSTYQASPVRVDF